jgi:hypothetical protein
VPDVGVVLFDAGASVDEVHDRVFAAYTAAFV